MRHRIMPVSAWCWLSVTAIVTSVPHFFAWFMSTDLGGQAGSHSGQGNYSSMMTWLETRLSRQAAAWEQGRVLV